MRNLLAIDTAIGSSVGLTAGDDVFTAVSDDPRGHAEVVGSLVAQVLEQAGSPAIDAVVMGVGPGPFTGLRVGMAAAHGFAQGAGAQLLPVLSHEAAALQAVRAGRTGVFRVLQDAKRREYFVSEWEFGDAKLPVMLQEPHLLPVAEYAANESDFFPDAICPEALLEVAKTRLSQGFDFISPEPWYLREPDVKQPAPVKRVST